MYVSLEYENFGPNGYGGRRIYKFGDLVATTSSSIPLRDCLLDWIDWKYTCGNYLTINRIAGRYYCNKYCCISECCRSMSL